jgi:hypothetical protein
MAVCLQGSPDGEEVTYLDDHGRVYSGPDAEADARAGDASVDADDDGDELDHGVLHDDEEHDDDDEEHDELEHGGALGSVR